MNGVRAGFGIRLAAGNFCPIPHSKSGLWVRLKDGETAADVKMPDRRLGTMIGKGSVIAYHD
jgi:NitT/TauT family transport system substrate-binding protein